MGLIAFVRFLVQLEDAAVKSILERNDVFGLEPFELQSFQDLAFLKRLCKAGQSEENYPDMYHLWTARRNEMDCFLTLDRRLVNTARNIVLKRNQPKLEVILPSDLLAKLRLTPDPLPIEEGMFYPIFGGKRPVENIFG